MILKSIDEVDPALPCKRSSQIIFKPIKEQYLVNETINLDVVLPFPGFDSPSDVIALYPVGWTDPMNFVTFEWISECCLSQVTSSGEMEKSFIFHPYVNNKAILSSATYQFVYIRKLSKVLGHSSIFSFFKECSYNDDFEIMTVSPNHFPNECGDNGDSSLVNLAFLECSKQDPGKINEVKPLTDQNEFLENRIHELQEENMALLERCEKLQNLLQFMAKRRKKSLMLEDVIRALECNQIVKVVGHKAEIHIKMIEQVERTRYVCNSTITTTNSSKIDSWSNRSFLLSTYQTLQENLRGIGAAWQIRKKLCPIYIRIWPTIHCSPSEILLKNKANQDCHQIPSFYKKSLDSPRDEDYFDALENIEVSEIVEPLPLKAVKTFFPDILAKFSNAVLCKRALELKQHINDIMHKKKANQSKMIVELDIDKSWLNKSKAIKKVDLEMLYPAKIANL